jgi:hypothetical protein
MSPLHLVEVVAEVGDSNTPGHASADNDQANQDGAESIHALSFV